MVAAGLLAKKAVEHGLETKPWVKTSLAPGSKVVTDYLARRRARHVPRPAPLQPGRLRLHDLHRQLRPAARGRSPSRSTRRPGRRRRAERQPQLRGPDQPRRPGQLPGLAAAGRRLRPGRHDGHRPPERAARHRPARASRSTSRTSGPPSARSRTRSCKSVRSEMFQSEYAEVFQGDEHWSSLPVPQGDLYEWDAASTYVKNPPYFVDMTDRAAAGRADRGGAGAGGAGRQHHDRPHLAGRLDQAGQPGGPLPDRARRRAPPTSTRTARGAATTR